MMSSELKEIGSFACVVAMPAIIFMAIVLLFSALDNNYIRGNRYTSCIERQSVIGKLTYDEMKEVCGEYLE